MRGFPYRGMVGLAVALSLWGGSARAQFDPGKYVLTAEERQTLTQGRDHLRQRVQELREQSRKTGTPRLEALPDVEIYLDAVDRNLDQNLFFVKGNVGQAQACLKEGETRVDALLTGKTPWLEQTGVVILGYRSEVDGSAQPYQAYIPTVYRAGAQTPLRLDIFLHGRGSTLTELAFIRGTGWVKGDFGPTPPAGFALYPYGRGNNGWRYAGERDVFEALADFRRRFPVDADRTTLRGFSMGGHGAWHLGLQHPGLWAALSPGAGFVETKRYHKLTGPLPDWQDALLHLYDPLDYAANAKDLSLIHYVGETDTFYAQHQIMDAMLKQEGAPYREYVGPQTGHRYEAKALQSLLSDMAPLRREPDAPNVDFVTYTLRFPECKWVHLEGLVQHWQRAEIHARRIAPTQIEVTTKNVHAFRLTPKEWIPNGSVRIDGQTMRMRAGQPDANGVTTLTFVRNGSRWTPGTQQKTHKHPGVQGPIEDGLFGSVLAVRGTGTAWNGAVENWTKQELADFREGWGRYCRATLPETTDAAVTAADIRDKNLYLFGDPGSNAVLKRLLPKLPLKWTQTTITLGGKTFAAGEHIPVMIFPNPDSPKHYIILNVGFTFSRADRDGSNSQQYPHLPDYAVLKITPDAYNDDRTKNTVLAGFFDEDWQIPMGR